MENETISCQIELFGQYFNVCLWPLQNDQLVHYTGYTLDELIPLTAQLNAMISAPPNKNLNTIRSKYSHRYDQRERYTQVTVYLILRFNITTVPQILQNGLETGLRTIESIKSGLILL